MVSTDDSVKPIHEMRKAVKKLRYSLELLPRDGPTGKLLRSLRELQDALGRIHDRDVFIGCLHGLDKTAQVTAAVEKESRVRAEEFRGFVDGYRRSKLPDAPFPGWTQGGAASAQPATPQLLTSARVGVVRVAAMARLSRGPERARTHPVSVFHHAWRSMLRSSSSSHSVSRMYSLIIPIRV
jgi:hypothetical protein